MPEPTGDHHYAADLDELEGTDRLLTEVNGLEVAVFRVEDDLYAVSNYCVHQGGPACEGRVSGILTVDDEGELIYDRNGEIVSCPWHGWEFDIRTGEHLANPRYRLPTFDVLVHDGEIYIEW